jgi:hypothetical protein
VRRALACAILAWAAFPPAASAQLYRRYDLPRKGSVEFAGGVVWTGGFDQGDLSAAETRNSATDNSPFVLFTAASRTEPAIGAQARIGAYVAKTFSIEGGFEYARPEISADLGNDAELASDVTATEKLTRFVVDGSGLFHLTGIAFNGGNGVPFLRAGAGYIRDVHEKNEVIDTGIEYHAGGGVKMWFGNGKHRTGLRFDGGIMFRRKGADLSDKMRHLGTAGASIVYLF